MRLRGVPIDGDGDHVGEEDGQPNGEGCEHRQVGSRLSSDAIGGREHLRSILLIVSIRTADPKTVPNSVSSERIVV